MSDKKLGLEPLPKEIPIARNFSEQAGYIHRRLFAHVDVPDHPISGHQSSLRPLGKDRPASGHGESRDSG